MLGFPTLADSAAQEE